MSDAYQPATMKPASPAPNAGFSGGDLFSQNPGMLSLLGGSQLGGIVPGITQGAMQPSVSLPPMPAPVGEMMQGAEGITDKITGPIQSAASAAPQMPSDLGSFLQMLFSHIPGLEQAFGQIPGAQGMVANGNDIWSQIRSKLGIGGS